MFENLGILYELVLFFGSDANFSASSFARDNSELSILRKDITETRIQKWITVLL